MFVSDVRDNLRDLIDEKGYIQAAIARKANITPAQLSSILNKKRKLDANEFFTLCNILEIKPEELASYRRSS